MFLKDVDLNYIKTYLRIDDDTDDTLIESLWLAAISYIKSYTALDEEEINQHASLVPIALIYVSNLYDNRTYEVNERINTSKNTQIEGVLKMYSKNNIAL